MEFFGGGALQLKALIIGAGVALVACLGLTTWALLERAGRLELKVEVVRKDDQIKILGDQLSRQTAAVVDVGRISAAIRGDLRVDLARLEQLAKQQAPALQRLEELARQAPPKRADGSPADCRDAWIEILKGGKP